MKNQKKSTGQGWKLLSLLVLLLLIGTELVAIGRLWKLALLPLKYFLAICGVFALLTLILGLLMFPKIGRHQRSKGTGRRITAYVLSAAVMLGSGVGSRMLGKLGETFENVTRPTTVKAYLSLYVSSEDPAQELDDAKDYTLAVTQAFGAENLSTALADLEARWGAAPKTLSFPTVFAMIDALYDGSVQGLLMDEAYLSILQDAEGYEDFEVRARQLHRHEVVVEQPTLPTEPEGTIPPDQPKPQPDDPFIIYLSGSDTRSAVLTQSRSDVNILAVLNPRTHEMLLVNTPRDYYVPNPAGNGALDKLTHCGLYGQECSAQALGDLYGQSIRYYAQINFTGFETLIDSVGGINVRSDFDDGVYLRQGDNYMDGKKALEFARNRYSYSDGDNARGRHQMQVIQATVEKLLSGSIITHYSEILDSLQGMFVTNMPSEKISQLIRMQLDNMAPWHISSFAVTGTGGSNIPYSMPGLYAYVMYPDQSSVDHASHLIQQVLDGASLTEADLKLPQ